MLASVSAVCLGVLLIAFMHCLNCTVWHYCVCDCWV